MGSHPRLTLAQVFTGSGDGRTELTMTNRSNGVRAALKHTLGKFRVASAVEEFEELYVPTRRTMVNGRGTNRWIIDVLDAIDAAPDLRRYLSTAEERKHEVVFRVPILGSTINLVFAETSLGYAAGAFGTHPSARRWLNDTVITDTRLLVDDSGRQIHFYGVDANSEHAAETFIEFARLIRFLRTKEEVGAYDAEEYINAYWSSAVVNFGDWLGPHLLRRLTGRRPVQTNRLGLASRGLYSVGSVAGWFQQNNVDVWGSGLIKPLDEKEIRERRKLKGVEIHAVRGKLTQQQLEDTLGWAVPSVYGDPALLLPEFYLPENATSRKIALAPHGVHQAYFKNLDDTEIDLVNVRRDFRDVVSSIANSRAVISTSLHGLIVAQAYGVPWIWLNISDNPLWGEDFKFNDFFSTVDPDAVSVRRVSKAELPKLDLVGLASEARLPKLKIDLNELRRALPSRWSSRLGDAENFTATDQSLSGIRMLT